MKLKIANIVERKLEEAAVRSDTSIEPRDVRPLTAAITEAIERPIARVEENLTNREPWYRSRVILGLLVALIAKTLEHFFGIVLDPGDSAELVTLLLDGITYAGAGYALIGRIVAKPAIGR